MNVSEIEVEPLINLPLCPDNARVIECSGSFAPCLLSAMIECHEGDLICLTRHKVNTPNSSMTFSRYAGFTTTPYTPALLGGVDHPVRPLPRMRSRADLFPAEPKIEAFLTDLAVHGNIAAATLARIIHEG